MGLRSLVLSVALFSSSCAPMKAHVKEVAKDDFEKIVLKSEKPVVVDFYVDWCGPCKEMKEPYRRIAYDYAGMADFVKLDADANKEIKKKYSVRGYPTTLVFFHGEEKCRYLGFRDEEKLRKNLESCFEKISSGK